MSRIEVVPTVVPSSFAAVEEAVSRYAPFARVLHIDFADGRFAPNTTWMPDGAPIAGMEWEAHLMVKKPRDLGIACIAAGASRIIGHIEATAHETPEILDTWRNEGAGEVGLALLAQTPIEALDPFTNQCNFATMMAIQHIGVQGLPFDRGAPTRVSALHARHPALLIEVDGSVNEETIVQLSRAGASRLCAGSVLSTSSDPASTYSSLIARAESALE